MFKKSSRMILLLLLFCLVVSQMNAMDLHVWEFPRIANPKDPNDRFSWISNLLRQFEEKNPGVKVHLTELTWQQGEDKLKIAVYAGLAPDITSGILPLHFVDQGVVSPIDDHLSSEDRADYQASALSAFTWRGKTWGWPWCSKCDALFLNLDLFESCGVKAPLGGRWTLKQFLETVKKLTKDKDGDGEIDQWGVNFCLSLGRTAEYGFLLQPGSPFLTADGKGLALAEKEAGIAGLRLLKSFSKSQKVAPPEAGGQSPKDVWLAFFERRATAVMPCGLWALKALRKKRPFAFTLAHFPDGKNGKPQVVASTAGYYVFRRPKDPAREMMAHKLARFLTLGKNQRVLELYGQFPTRKSAGKLYQGDELMERAEAICQYSRSLPTTPAWARIDETIKRNLQIGTLGHEKLDECAKNIASKCREHLSKADEKRVTSNVGNVVMSTMALLLTTLLIWFLYSLITAKKKQRDEELIAWTFLLPSLLVLGLFFAYPAFRAVLLAFQQYRIHQGLFDNFVGLKHFRAILSDDNFRIALVNTAVYTALVVPANLLTGLILASLIAPLSARWRHLFRGAFYLPGVTSVVVLAMVWRWLYDAEYGVINGVLLAGKNGPWQWVYQLVRNFAELPPSFPRLVLWAAAIGALALLTRQGHISGLVKRVDKSVRNAFGHGKGPIARVVAALDFAAGDIGLTTFVLVTIGSIGLVVLAMAAVPFKIFAVKPIGWLTSPNLSLFSIIWSMVIRGPGGALIIYLAALESCPKELYEVAEIDGASPLASWWHITLPLLRPTSLFLLVTQTIGSFQVFAQVSLLTDGGPGTSSSVIVHKIYTTAFRDCEFGSASAQAMILFAIIALISAIQFAVLGDEE